MHELLYFPAVNNVFKMIVLFGGWGFGRSHARDPSLVLILSVNQLSLAYEFAKYYVGQLTYHF